MLVIVSRIMTSKGLLFLVAGAVVLGVLFLAFKPEVPVPPPAGGPAPIAAVAASRVPRAVELVVRDGELLAGPAVITLQQDEELTLRVTSDRPDELHLHGYDLALKLQPGAPVELRFRATRSGRFEYELHHAHAELGVVEVRPR